MPGSSSSTPKPRTARTLSRRSHFTDRGVALPTPHTSGRDRARVIQDRTTTPNHRRRSPTDTSPSPLFRRASPFRRFANLSSNPVRTLLQQSLRFRRRVIDPRRLVKTAVTATVRAGRLGSRSSSVDDLSISGSSDYLGGCPVAGVDFQGISPMSNGCMEIPRSAAIPLLGEAEAGSAGKPPAKEYPGLRCANGVSAPG